MKLLTEIVSELESGSRPKGGVTSEGDIPSLGAEHLDNEGGFYFKNIKRVSKEFFYSLKSGKLSTNDILIVKDGATTGKVSYLTEDFPFAEASINEHVFRIKINDKIAVPKYVFHFLKSELGNRQIMADFRGATVGGISRKFTDRVIIPLPTLKDQQRIATILDHADSIRRKNQQILEKYNELEESVFYEMFGDPVTNPKGWKIAKLKDLSTRINSGNTPKGGSKVYVENGIVFFRSQNVWRNNLEMEDVAYIDFETHNKMRKTSLKNGDILMTKTGRINTENSSLGRAAMFLGKDNSANINGHVYLIRLQNNIVKEFILFILTTSSYRDYIRRVCVGGIDKRQINKEHLEEFPIISPPNELQIRFAEILKNVYQQKVLAKQSLRKSEDLFQRLLQKAFKGEL